MAKKKPQKPIFEWQKIGFNECPFAMVRALAFSLMENKPSGFIAPAGEIPDEVCEEGLKKIRAIMSGLGKFGKAPVQEDLEEKKRRQIAALGV